MKIALSGTELEEGEPLTELINGAKDNAISWLELWFPRNLYFDEWEQQIASASLQVACVSSGTELVQDGDVSKAQADLIAAIELAHRLNAPFANTYFGYRTHRDDNSAMDIYCKNLLPCLKRAEALGVTIVLENEFDVFGIDHEATDVTRRPEVLLRLVRRIDSPYFRLNFDPCNAYFAGVEPFPLAYDLLQPYIAYIHVKDGCCTSQNEREDSYWKYFSDMGRKYRTCPLGDGAVNWHGMMRRLVADRYDSFITLEPHAQRSYRSGAWDHAVQVMRQWLDQTERRASE